MEKDRINILGGGPAGASAALSTIQCGVRVRVMERPRVVAEPNRHKVCGEFFSPEIESDLDRLGVWQDFAAAGPARIHRMVLHFGARSKSARLPEPGWGLSRYAFDEMLLRLAWERGAELVGRGAQGSLTTPGASGIAGSRDDSAEGREKIHILATGRRADGAITKGERLFGFKAHFDGPVDDAVELFFFNGCYVGINCIEVGKTNVCGLGPERELKRLGFEYDGILGQCGPLRDRLRPMHRVMPWITTGPLEFGQRMQPSSDGPLLAGDALSFVDPFTGSGLLAAVRSGTLAGKAAAQNSPASVYTEQVRSSLRTPFHAASFLRFMVRSGWAERLVGMVPGQLLFALTRPR
ncbi:MAG: hypothetical protein ABI824_12555 [Acidobacteriota bacterium]